jgi:hypothetical protein
LRRRSRGLRMRLNRRACWAYLWLMMMLWLDWLVKGVVGLECCAASHSILSS